MTTNELMHALNVLDPDRSQTRVEAVEEEIRIFGGPLPEALTASDRGFIEKHGWTHQMIFRSPNTGIPLMTPQSWWANEK